MRAAFPARRRADEFDALLEGTLTQAPSAELAQLVEVVARVRTVPDVAPRAEFAAGLRERLMTEAPEALSTPSTDEAAARLTVRHRTPDKPRSKTSRERRIGVAIAAFSLVGATTASAVASQGALPGDTLYPVKRLLEDARTSLAMGEDAKGDVLLAQARTRLAEVRELGSRREDAAPADIERALRDFSDTADHASTVILADYADHGDRRPVDQLRSFTEQSVTTLSGLTGVLPASVDDVLADVADTLVQIDQSAAEACPACDTHGVTELPSDLIALRSAVTGATKDATVAVAPSPTGTATRGPKGNPSAGASTAPTGSPSGQTNGPVGNPTGGRTSPAPGPSSAPTSAPTSAGGVVGGVGGAVGGTVGGVGGAVGDLGDQVGGPVGGVLGGVGGTVGGLGDTVGGATGQVGGTVDGVVGGLLGGTTPTPKTKP